MRCLVCHQNGVSLDAILCPNCSSHLPSQRRDLLKPGAMLEGGLYRIEYPIGHGGFGVTYRVVDTGLDYRVAIKEFFPRAFVDRDDATGRVIVPSPHQQKFKGWLDRFGREGRTLAKLDNHPYIVRIKDLFAENGTAYLVMEMIEGRTLKEEMQSRASARMSLDRVRQVMEQIVSALEAVHEHGIYHLDVKPDNIMVRADGRIALIDFGAAKRGIGDGGKSSTRAYTMEYVAPEVVSGEEVGPFSDVFETAMLLHEMLTGEPPPPCLTRVRRDDWTPNKLDAPWRDILHWALRMNAEERPRSIKQWWETESQWRQGQERLRLEEQERQRTEQEQQRLDRERAIARRAESKSSELELNRNELLHHIDGQQQTIQAQSRLIEKYEQEMEPVEVVRRLIDEWRDLWTFHAREELPLNAFLHRLLDFVSEWGVALVLHFFPLVTNVFVLTCLCFGKEVTWLNGGWMFIVLVISLFLCSQAKQVAEQDLGIVWSEALYEYGKINGRIACFLLFPVIIGIFW